MKLNLIHKITALAAGVLLLSGCTISFGTQGEEAPAPLPPATTSEPVETTPVPTPVETTPEPVATISADEQLFENLRIVFPNNAWTAEDFASLVPIAVATCADLDAGTSWESISTTIYSSTDLTAEAKDLVGTVALLAPESHCPQHITSRDVYVQGTST